VANEQTRRYFLLDELRGMAVVAMTVYHALFLLGEVFGDETMLVWFRAARPVQPFIAGTFILVCGICCRFSRSNAKRGFKLAGFALGFTLGTWLITALGIFDGVIIFGILHFLAAAILLFCLLRRLLEKIPSWVQVPGFLALFFGAWFVRLPWTDSLFLYILGFPSWAWQSADYFPLWPWLFLFFAGTGIGAWGQQGKFPQWFDAPRCRPLRWAGKHAIWIYLAHQPVMFAVASLWLFIVS